MFLTVFAWAFPGFSYFTGSLVYRRYMWVLSQPALAVYLGMVNVMCASTSEIALDGFRGAVVVWSLLLITLIMEVVFYPALLASALRLVFLLIPVRYILLYATVGAIGLLTVSVLSVRRLPPRSRPLVLFSLVGVAIEEYGLRCAVHCRSV